ncbi:MAG: alpha-keto-acid decarboxylase [Pseudonocardiales bacterium]|jgi:indolepyruvate decarboxylase|nr:alpha-keto-acid decarboxylase [Pseudonocardiales bacterium]
MTTATTTTTVGSYLATRLVQLGVTHLFGLPGDFNLTLLDELLAVEGIDWSGSTNELNAAYTADGYARAARRPGALVTAHGVGELSAMNGIAGSYAEDVPVVHIVGMPSRAAIERRSPLHHTLLDGDFLRFQRMFREVTAAQAVLDPGTAAQEIDRVLLTALNTSKPVYLGVPMDVANAPVLGEPLRIPLRCMGSEPAAVEKFRKALERRFVSEKGLTMLAGPRIHRRGLESTVAELAGLPGVRVASQPGSNALLDDDHPASLGTYFGAATRSDEAREAIDNASLLVMAGTVESDFTTGSFTHRYDSALAVELTVDHARIGPVVYPGVRLEDSLRVLHQLVSKSQYADASAVARTAPTSVPAGNLDEPLNHKRFWAGVQDWLPPSTTVAAEIGTALYGALDLRLPPDSDLLDQPVWSSIGFTLPAVLGAALARPDRRPVLFIGDGSAQLTVQELGTFNARGIRPVVFVLNNDGYTVERILQSPKADYHDIVQWNWTQLPAALGGTDVRTAKVRTVRELRDALQGASDPEHAWLIEVMLPRLDVPRLLVQLARGKSTNE